MRYGHFVMSIFCAWVLWSTTIDRTTGDTTYDVGGADPTYEECLNDFAIMQKHAKEKEKSAEPKPRFYVGYLCLPDTVDPRAPKAK